MGLQPALYRGVAGGIEPRAVPLGEAQLRVPTRTAGILGDLEAAIRRELGADRICE